MLVKGRVESNPKYQRFNFLFLTILDQKMRPPSEQLSPPVNLQFSSDSQEPVGTQTPDSERSCSQLSGHPQSQAECPRPTVAQKMKDSRSLVGDKVICFAVCGTK